jgi:hypothetical protein
LIHSGTELVSMDAASVASVSSVAAGPGVGPPVRVTSNVMGVSDQSDIVSRIMIRRASGTSWMWLGVPLEGLESSVIWKVPSGATCSCDVLMLPRIVWSCPFSSGPWSMSWNEMSSLVPRWPVMT